MVGWDDFEIFNPDRNGKQKVALNYSFFSIKKRPKKAIFILLKTV
jgi:hypothetical protein